MFRRVQTPQLGHLRRLDPLEYFLSAARASRRFEQCRAARAVGWPICQIFPKPENPGFPVFPKIRQSPPPAVHAGRPSSEAHGALRARTAKQNAPRPSSCSTRERVVRFVSRLSRARGHVLSLSWAPGGARGSKFCIKSISWLGKKYPVLPADLVIFSCPWVSQKKGEVRHTLDNFWT